jgi:hypothetical protein
MFEARHDPLPPQPMRGDRSVLDDLPDARPRAARQPVPISRSRTPELITPDEPMPFAGRARESLAGDLAELRQANVMVEEFHRPRPVYYDAPAPSGITLALPQGRTLPLLLLALVFGVITWFLLTPSKTFISTYGAFERSPASGATGKGLALQIAPDGEHTVVGLPSISPDLVDAVLTKYGSPAAGTGNTWIELGQHYGIDPAYALAFFIHESSAGTNPGWAGLKPGGGSTHNVGNIICAGYPTCFGRFRDYNDWNAGIEDWYKLISQEYIAGRGAQTVEQIIPIYAPASDNNNVSNYIQSVVNQVEGWRQGVIQ